MNSFESKRPERRKEPHQAASARLTVGAAASGRSPVERTTRGVPEKVGSSRLNGLLTNRLLASLPEKDFARLLSHLEPVNLSAGEDLYRFEAGVPFAYFPESAVISQLHVLMDGNTTEAAMIGRDGFVGLSAVFNACQPNYWSRVLIGGTALRVKSEVLRQEFNRAGSMQERVLAYASARMLQLSQRAVCNGRHTVEERLCSWLLMVHDRAQEDRLHLTHEQIASHLGARRAGITIAATALRDQGVLCYSRGIMRILDRRGLEANACECYSLLRHQAINV